MTDRIQGRVDCITAQMHKLDTQMKADPKSPKHARRKKKWNEFVTSLKNIQEFGRERMPTGNPVGVTIDVPLGFLKLKTLTPGG